MKFSLWVFALSALVFSATASNAFETEQIQWVCTGNHNVQDVPTYGQPYQPAEKLYIAFTGSDYYVVGNFPNHTPGLRIKLEMVSQNSSGMVLRYEDTEMHVVIAKDCASILYESDPFYRYNCVPASSVEDL